MKYMYNGTCPMFYWTCVLISKAIYVLEHTSHQLLTCHPPSPSLEIMACRIWYARTRLLVYIIQYMRYKTLARECPQKSINSDLVCMITSVGRYLNPLLQVYRWERCHYNFHLKEIMTDRPTNELIKKDVCKISE